MAFESLLNRSEPGEYTSVTFQITDKDRDSAQRIANKLGVSLSAVLRALVSDALPRLREATEDLR